MHITMRLKPKRRDVLISFLVILGVSFVLQLTIFLNRESWNSQYTSASEFQLYCTRPYVNEISHFGFGRVELTFPVDEKNIELVDSRGNHLQSNENSIEVQLHPDINHFEVVIEKVRKQLDLEYTPPETYIEKGNTSWRDGVVILRNTGLCVGSPVIADPHDWSPISKKSPNGENEANLQWEDLVARIVLELEGLRGIPTSLAEDTPSKDLALLIQRRSSSVWCTQIARYTVEKLKEKIGIRLVSSGGTLPGSSVLIGGHTFIEILDKNTGRWAVVDPTNYLLGIRWSDGNPVNAVEFQRIISLPNNIESLGLIFTMVDPVSGKIFKSDWDHIQDKLRNDFQFYFSIKNRLYYFTGLSSAFRKNLAASIDNWMRRDRRFVLSQPGTYPALSTIRVVSFWSMIFSFFGSILIIFYVFRGHLRIRSAPKNSSGISLEFARKNKK